MQKILLFILSIWCFKSLSQEQAIAKVQYLLTHVNDTTKHDHAVKNETATYLGNTSSYFTDDTTLDVQAMFKKQASAPDFDGRIVIKRTAHPLKTFYITSPAKQKMQEIIHVAGEPFGIDIAYDAPDWELYEDTLTVGGYLCQKATTTFKGRNYTAWFTTELPFPFGPWKLHGLPGLILSAQDDKKVVIFAYNGFDRIDAENPRLIEAPENTIPANREEVERLEKAFRENPSAYHQSRQSVRRPRTVLTTGTNTNSIDPSKIKSIDIMNDENYKMSGTTNNPIELAP